MPQSEVTNSGKVRPAAVAGRFYPADATRLREEIIAYLGAHETSTDVVPKALIAPHAGYIYSGPIAASAYALLNTARDRIRRVVLLGPAHTIAFRGIAASSAAAFATPLGLVAVDDQALRTVCAQPQVRVLDEAHAREHAIEVHLPFLQVVLSEFKIVPLVVGDAEDNEVREALDKVWGAQETLIIISSDLSHYHDYATAQRLDQAVARAIEHLRPEDVREEQACGRIPMRGLLCAARQRRMRVRTLDLRNSGDTAGPRHEVVGYGAWAFEEAAELEVRD